MGVTAGESVLIIADTNKQRIGKALFDAASEAKCEAMYIVMLPRTHHGEEPPTGIAELMKNVDVVVHQVLIVFLVQVYHQQHV